MSTTAHAEPACKRAAESSVSLTIEGRARALGGGFSVRRLLPAAERRSVGPFVFFDHMGPTALDPGAGLDVRPHPHINLATVTYLFTGEILHRDSLGSEQPIRPGEVNWMTAGRGIVHSERSPEHERRKGPHLHGLQLWVALPRAVEECEPSFHHYAAADIPVVERDLARLHVVAGAAYGATSPVRVSSPLFYVDAQLQAGAHLEVPVELGERAFYVVTGVISCAGASHASGTMVVLRDDAPVEIAAVEAARVMLLGGAPLDGERYLWWNFVSSSAERIEQAKDDWRNGRFPQVPGDAEEFIPLPDA